MNMDNLDRIYEEEGSQIHVLCSPALCQRRWQAFALLAKGCFTMCRIQHNTEVPIIVDCVIFVQHYYFNLKCLGLCQFVLFNTFFIMWLRTIINGLFFIWGLPVFLVNGCANNCGVRRTFVLFPDLYIWPPLVEVVCSVTSYILIQCMLWNDPEIWCDLKRLQCAQGLRCWDLH